MTNHYVLAGDIGGTNCRLSLHAVPKESFGHSEADIVRRHRTVYTFNYKTEKHATFNLCLNEFIKECLKSLGTDSIDITACCLACAGPVIGNKVVFTNNSWVISASEISANFAIPHVQLINDFVANGYGLLTLNDQEYQVVQEGVPTPNSPIALLGAGTGLGECFLTAAQSCLPTQAGEHMAVSGGGVYDAWPTEGGHVEYAPLDDLEAELLAFLRAKFKGRVSVERVVSGKGLVNVYEFLRERFPEQVIEKHDRRIMGEAIEGGRVIAELTYDYPLAGKAISIMMKAYGSEAGNVALKYLPYGCLYIAGGIAPKLRDYIIGPKTPFMEAFHNKGRVSSCLKDVPVRLVLSEDLGMRGAHVKAYRMLKEAHTLASPSPVAAAVEAILPASITHAHVSAQQMVLVAAVAAAVGCLFAKYVKA